MNNKRKEKNEIKTKEALVKMYIALFGSDRDLLLLSMMEGEDETI